MEEARWRIGGGERLAIIICGDGRKGKGTGGEEGVSVSRVGRTDELLFREPGCVLVPVGHPTYVINFRLAE